MGDFTSQCATRHNLDSARRDAFARRGWGGSRRRLLGSALLAAAFVLVGGGGGTALALAIRGGGGSGPGAGGDHSSATLIVHKDFVPNAPTASVTFSVTCTNGGRPDRSPKTATEAAPAVFSITGFGEGATCTATEAASPTGYRTIARGCREVSIAAGASRSCTITNRRKGVTSATLTVHKEFVPNASTASVTISVTCKQGGQPEKSPKRATEAAPAVFTITKFGKRPTCTATESPRLTGYSANDSDCRNLTITRGGSVSCTIINTRKSVTSATLTVSKDFSDNNQAKVSIAVTCDSGAVAETPLLASENSPAVFAITGFGPGATCTASEGTPPPGYTADESDCQRVPITNGGSPACQVVDTLNSITLTVRKDFTNKSTSTVSFSLTCTSGTVTQTPLPASPSSPAVFKITGFVTGVSCSASEGTPPTGYTADESDCQDVSLASRGECTIVNSPTPPR